MEYLDAVAYYQETVDAQEKVDAIWEHSETWLALLSTSWLALVIFSIATPLLYVHGAPTAFISSGIGWLIAFFAVMEGLGAKRRRNTACDFFHLSEGATEGQIRTARAVLARQLATHVRRRLHGMPDSTTDEDVLTAASRHQQLTLGEHPTAELLAIYRKTRREKFAQLLQEEITIHTDGQVIEVSKDNFDEQVRKTNRPVLIDFYATWCGSCERQGPIFLQTAKSYAGRVKFVKIDVTNNQELVEEIGISVIPTLVFILGTRKIAHEGLLDESALKQFIDDGLSAKNPQHC